MHFPTVSYTQWTKSLSVAVFSQYTHVTDRRTHTGMTTGFGYV